MKKLMILSCYSLCSMIACSSSSALKIGVITDTHFLSKKLMDNGKAINNQQEALGRNLTDFEAVLDQTLENFTNESIDILLIPGDLTFNGEKQSHLELSQKLNELTKKDIRVFVVPGNHDISIPNPLAYHGSETFPVENITAWDFEQIYAECGYKAAIKRDESSLSYVVELNDDIWLLAIDACMYQEYTNRGITAGRILPETEQWILNVLKDARQQGKKVIGMMHHGLVEHVVFQEMILPQYLVKDWKRLAGLFADNGLRFIFTGHFHSHDISEYVTDAGNKIYDIETGSLQTYPYPYRTVTANGNSLDIKTQNITAIPNNSRLLEEGKVLVKNWLKRIIKQQVNKRAAEVPENLLNEIMDFGSELFPMHIEGDEVLDENMQKRLTEIVTALDIPIDLSPEALQFDFPPADKNVELFWE